MGTDETSHTPRPQSAAAYHELTVRFATCMQVFTQRQAEAPEVRPMITTCFNELMAAIGTYPPEHRVEMLAAVANAVTAAVDYLRHTEEAQA